MRGKMTIKILNSQVIARIAAGEVVERPAAAVKELVENSLDAGATVIAIEAKGGGIGLIRVIDNGQGIPPGQLELAFHRHATSKIISEADLESISTLGFRGEALPSIAAVAEVELVSCSNGDATGHYITLNDGQVTRHGIQGRPQGTTVTVRHLFRSFPARLKFLRSPATENSHLAVVVSQYALAYPEVKFNLAVDEKNIFSSPGTGNLRDAVLAVHGLETARNMLEIERDERWRDHAADRNITISGLIGTPQIARSSRDYLSFFVNRRWISSRLLARAVADAYHGLLPVGRHPVVVINIELPAREVDVNIHPAKSEVKFRDEHAVFGAVQKAVRGTLLSAAPVPTIQQTAGNYTALTRHAPVPTSTSSSPARIPATPLPVFAEIISPEKAAPLLRNALPALRPVGQIAATYIVAEGPDGLYLIDQHAAHERILFEKVQRQQNGRGIEVQGLLEPVVFEVTPRQDALLKLPGKDGAEALTVILTDFGITLEPFGKMTYLLRASPAGFDSKQAITALRESLDTPAGATDWREKIAQSLACHGAVRAGQALDGDELRQLIRELEQTSNPHTCPHGRPTILHLGLSQLEKEFKRT